LKLNKLKERYYEMADEEGVGLILNLETPLLCAKGQVFFRVTYTFLTVVSYEQYHEH
jgi:hypothetical protein